jgi:hypothetical protein
VKARLALPLAALLFVIVATANAGGYRYGVSDQAFYVPAIDWSVNPALFPRDRTLLEPQMRLWVGDEILGAAARAMGGQLPMLFFWLYVATLLALFGAAVMFGRSLGGSWWAVAAFVVLLTLRHRIAKTGANTLEGYMHPRMLAFAVGLAALACIVRQRVPAAIALVAVAAVIHPTTAMWFGAAVAVAAIAITRRWTLSAIGAGAVVIVGIWAVTAGPVAGRLAVMDEAWLTAVAEKDYLFVTDWPAYAWIANLAYPVVIVVLYLRRRSLGVIEPGEGALLAGLLALVAIFLVSVPLTAARVALAVELQVNRIFWVLDAVVAFYMAWWLTSGALARPAAYWTPHGDNEVTTRRVAVMALLAALAIGRGYFVLVVDSARPLVQLSLPANTWTETMAWLRDQPASWHVLADPGHGWKYGVSVRVAATKDVLLESGKDSAMSMYDRASALRVVERSAALVAFDDLTPERVHALDVRYDLDVFVGRADRRFDLPVLYQNRDFVVYDLR